MARPSLARFASSSKQGGFPVVGLLNFNHILTRTVPFLLASPVLAQTPADVVAAGQMHPMSAWIVVPIAIGSLLLLIVALSRVVHNDPDIERQMRSEAGDRPLIPFPDGDGHHHFH
jgi:hypothetical protein